MRPTLVCAFALAVAFTTPALAQQQPAAAQQPATTGQAHGSEQLRAAEQRLRQASERLQQAAQSGDRKAFAEAHEVAVQALQDVRRNLDQVPEGQRAQLEQRMTGAEQALQGQDPNAGAQAVAEVVRVVGLAILPTGGQQQQAMAEGRQQGAEILVQQPAPTIQVEQASPRVVVQQPEPQVTVRQRQPEIIVRQPAPTVTVNIPQPEIIVRMPEPEVDVSQQQPEVQVVQAPPEVQVVQREQPRVQAQPSQPQVQLRQAGDAQPNVQIVDGGQQPQIRYERAEPRVVVNQPEGQPQIRVEEMQGQKAAQARHVAPSADQGTAAGAPAGRTFAGMRGEELMDKTVYGANGEEIGDVENVVVSRQDRAAALVVGVGGFLGIGERQVAIPLDRLQLGPDGRLTTTLVKDEIGAIPAYDERGYDRVGPGDRVRAVPNQ
jgi:sporulation protein YlmC with PRC-barrel domain